MTVAVKIVEHNQETEGSLNQLRESLLSSSIVHPNVVRPACLPPILGADCLPVLK